MGKAEEDAVRRYLELNVPEENLMVEKLTHTSEWKIPVQDVQGVLREINPEGTFLTWRHVISMTLEDGSRVEITQGDHTITIFFEEGVMEGRLFDMTLTPVEPTAEVLRHLLTKGYAMWREMP